MISKNVNTLWSPWSRTITQENPYPNGFKNPIQPDILGKRSPKDCYDLDETIADTMDCLCDTTEIISKPIRWSSGNHWGILIIQHFHRDELDYVICIGEVEISNFFQQRVVLQARISLGTLRREFTRGTQKDC